MHPQPRHGDGRFARKAHSEQALLSRWGHLTHAADPVTDAIERLDLAPGAAQTAAEHPSPLVRWHSRDQGYDLPEETWRGLSDDRGVRWVDRIQRGGRLEPYPV